MKTTSILPPKNITTIEHYPWSYPNLFPKEDQLSQRIWKDIPGGENRWTSTTVIQAAKLKPQRVWGFFGIDDNKLIQKAIKSHLRWIASDSTIFKHGQWPESLEGNNRYNVRRDFMDTLPSWADLCRRWKEALNIPISSKTADELLYQIFLKELSVIRSSSKENDNKKRKAAEDLQPAFIRNINQIAIHRSGTNYISDGDIKTTNPSATCRVIIIQLDPLLPSYPDKILNTTTGESSVTVISLSDSPTPSLHQSSNAIENGEVLKFISKVQGRSESGLG